MELQQLRTFAAVARLRSFTRAAQELHLSQPAVSRQIEALEGSLGTPLFSRQGRRVLLTEPGRVLLDYAERLLDLADQAARSLEELRRVRSGRLNLAASTTPGNYLLPEVLAAFQARHPDVEARMAVHPSGEVERLVLDGRADLGVAAGSLRSTALFAIPFVEDELVLVTPPGHPLAHPGMVTAGALAATLARARLLLREPASATRRAAEAHLRSLGIRPAHPVELGHTEAIKGAVAAGLGLAFISRYAVAAELKRGLVVAAGGPAAAIRRNLYFLSPKGARLSPTALAFQALAGKGGARPAASGARWMPAEGGISPWRTSGNRSA